MKKYEFHSGKKLIKTLVKNTGSNSYKEILEEYVVENSDNPLSWLISDNWDLLLGNNFRGTDVARALAQLALELPDDDSFRTAYLEEFLDFDLGPVYHCDKNSSFLNRKDYRLMGGHDNPVTAVLSMGSGKMVSGDMCGRILAWSSVYPPVCREIGMDSSEIKTLAILDEEKFYSISSGGNIKVWDYLSGRLLNEFSTDKEIVNTLAFSGNTIIVNVVIKTEKEMYLGIHEISIQKRIALKSYNLSQNEWIWEQEFDVNETSWIRPLPDGRLYLSREEAIGFPSCMNCGFASIIDPESGAVDEHFEWLAKDCEVQLYSALEMPVILKRRSGKYEFFRHDGSRIQINEYMQELLLIGYFPFLFPGSSFLLVGDERQILLEYPDYDADKAQECFFTDIHFIYQGRYLIGSTNYDEKTKGGLLKVYDFPRHKNVFTKTIFPGDESLLTHITDDETLLISTPRGHFVSKDLTTGDEFTVRDFGLASKATIDMAQQFKESGIVLIDSSGKLLVINPENAPSNLFLYEESVENVLGSRDALLFAEGFEGEVKVFDTDTCKKISTFGSFQRGVYGIIHLYDDFYGAWSAESGFKAWNARNGEEKYNYEMSGYELTAVLALSDDNLLCWGNKKPDRHEWDEARLAIFNPDTKNETELLKIRGNRDPFNGNIQFAKYNAIIGECLELSNGKLLIPPHRGVPYRKRTAFDIIILDRADPENLMRIPIEGFVPVRIEELPGGVLMICSRQLVNTGEVRISRVFFRSMDTGELLFSSHDLVEYVMDIIYLSNGLIGALLQNDLVSLFFVGDEIKYSGDKPIEEVLDMEQDIIDKNRKAKEIGKVGRLLQMPLLTFSGDYRWSELWGTWKGDSIIEIGSGSVGVGNPSHFTLALLRSVTEKAFLFDNAIVLLDSNDRIGFMRKWCAVKDSSS